MPPGPPSRDRPDAEPVAGGGASHRARGSLPLALAGHGEPVQRLDCDSRGLRPPPQLCSAARPLRLADRPGGCAAGTGPLPNIRPVGQRSRRAVHGNSPALRDGHQASTDHDQVISSYEDGLMFQWCSLLWDESMDLIAQDEHPLLGEDYPPPGGDPRNRFGSALISASRRICLRAPAVWRSGAMNGPPCSRSAPTDGITTLSAHHDECSAIDQTTRYLSEVPKCPSIAS
jgi:hypothetical protein